MEAAAGKRKRPVRNAAKVDVNAQRGLEHEQSFLHRLEESGRRVVAPPDAPSQSLAELREASAATTKLMRDGADIIYQGTLFDGRWLGRPDFLMRVEAPSGLGGWSYEAADAKLARHVKASAVLQSCVYSQLLTSTQNREPTQVHVVTGDAGVRSHRLADYMSYFREVRRRFEGRVGLAQQPNTYPEPVDHCH